MWLGLIGTGVVLFLFGGLGSLKMWPAEIHNFVKRAMQDYICVGSRVWFLEMGLLMPIVLNNLKIILN